jgi:beta-glucanase (GH16 family)
MNKHNIIFLFLAGTASIFSSCNTDDFQKLDQRNWTLTWSDEFDGQKNQTPDPKKWTYDIGQGQNGWGNGEFQTYTQRPENVSLDGQGNLVITALNVPFGGANFSSGRIKTQGLFAQKYGRFEARIKTPYGPGIWPAFWMLGENISQVGWPKCGEIDILELRGQVPGTIFGTLHGPGYSGGNPVSRSYSLINGRFDSDFYIYAIEWDEDKIDLFANDYLYARITKADIPGEWVYNQPFYMILNVAVGGNFVGFPTDKTPFPQSMTVDYVRVYQKAN